MIFVLLGVEAATLLSVRSLLTWHALVGVTLIPLVLLKLVTTGHRFVQYYRGDAAYRRKGPPHPILRALGPFLGVLTIALLGSGTILLVGGRAYRDPWRNIHQTVFYAWAALIAIHTLGHLLETVRLAPLDWRPKGERPLRKAGMRRSVLVGALAIGLVGGLAVQGRVTSWGHGRGSDRGRRDGAGRVSPPVETGRVPARVAATIRTP